tara:strand:+ start:3779 stop:3979 length:201 start_codon:yes stop_codon:yes gene_type:complete
MSDNNNSGGGIGLCGVLFIVFLVLKLCGVIAWSWWWVSAPLWIPLGLVACVAISIAVIYGLISVFK